MKILVICLGNINRSPLVAAFINKNSKHEVISAGLLEGGRKANPKMRGYAREHGLNLENHRALQIDAAMVEWADVILGFTDKHHQRLVHRVGPIALQRKWVNLAQHLQPARKSLADPAFNGKQLPTIANDCCIATRNWLETVK